MPIALSVNLNKIALIRNSRDGNYPDIEIFAQRCATAGANGLTAHPRPDQRHIRPSDVAILSSVVKENPLMELNIEGNPFAQAINDYPGLIDIVLEHKPHQCTLVPDSDSQKTSDHGFDLIEEAGRLSPIIKRLKDNGIRVSLFMDPDPIQVEIAHQIGADRIELYTGPFAWAYENDMAHAQNLFKNHCDAAKTATELGMGVNAGHDLNLENMQVYRFLPGLEEVSIGHALTVDSLTLGFEPAIAAYLELCQ